MNKKLSYYTSVFFIVCFSMCAVSCAGWFGIQNDGKRAVKREVKITITDIAPNDLGQVMIFGESEKGSTVLVKNFYRADKSRGAIHAESQKFAKGLLKLRGKKVTVIYRLDSIGNMEVLDIR